MNWTLPTLAECENHGIEPMCFRILVAPATVAEKSGGIILPDAIKARQDFGARKARVIAIGDMAHSNPKRVRPPTVGDVVLVQKYVGADEEVEGLDGRKYRLVNDLDIEAVLERASAEKSSAEAAKLSVVK